MSEVRLLLLGARSRVSVWLVTVVLTGHNSSMGSGARIAFELTSKRGAALMTSHLTHLERFERKLRFQAYIKKHYESWADFAREQEHGDDIKPVLVTGVDLTKEFSAMVYSDNRTRMQCELSVGSPMIGSASLSAWGSWSAPGLVHTNSGPTLGHTRAIQITDGGSVSRPGIPEDHDHCVFVRYYTIRGNFFVPMLIRAGAGLHKLPTPSRDDADVVMLEASDSDSNFGYPQPVIHN